MTHPNAGNMKQISERVRFLRSHTRMRQRECARLLHISLSHFAKIEQGIGGVSDSVLMAIATLFNAPFEWVRDGVGEPPSAFSPCNSSKEMPSDDSRLGEESESLRQQVVQIIGILKKPEVMALAGKLQAALKVSREDALKIIVKSGMK